MAQLKNNGTEKSGAFRRFFNWLVHLFQFKSSPGPLNSFDVEDLIAHFKITQEAKRLANLGLPAYHTKELTSIENDILKHINASRDQLQSDFTDSTLSLETQFADFERTYLHIKAETLSSEFDRKARQIMDTQGAWLKKLAEDALSKIAELNRFKTDNNIQRLANYPDQSRVTYQYALLVFLIALEGIVNSGFFAQGLDSGILGGFTYAALLASINVMGSFFLGKFLIRWLFHSKIFGKLLGLLGLLMWACFVVLMSIAISHLRESIIQGVPNPSEAALTSIQEHAFYIKDLISWFLMLITAGFGLGAMLDGIFIDDRYPGYGKISRRTELSKDIFESEFEDIQLELEDLKQEKLSFIENHLSKVRELMFSMQKNIEEKKRLYQKLEKNLNESEIALFALLRKFRYDNETSRDDGLKPAYFNTMPSLSPIRIPKFDLTKENGVVKNIQDHLEFSETNIADLRQEVYTVFDAYLTQINHLKYY